MRLPVNIKKTVLSSSGPFCRFACDYNLFLLATEFITDGNTERGVLPGIIYVVNRLFAHCIYKTQVGIQTEIKALWHFISNLDACAGVKTVQLKISGLIIKGFNFPCSGPYSAFQLTANTISQVWPYAQHQVTGTYLGFISEQNR